MKTLKYILFLFLSVGLLNSCLVESETDYDLNDDGNNLATFTKNSINLTALANGNQYPMQIQMKMVGPTIMDMKGDITVTVAAASTSTAVENKHYRIPNKTITLKNSDNYFGNLDIVLLTAGNAPPMDDTPEYLLYKAPVLDLVVTNATGEAKAAASGKQAKIILNFTPPNPYAGDYDVELKYFHPTAGGSYPNEPYGGVRALEKTLLPVTGRKCETGFAVWGETDICWITILADNSIIFVVDDTWPYDVKMGDPNDPSKISHYDPATGKIYLYYYYAGSGGNRIFWEVFTPAS
jgi:hypothetical protein